MSNCVGCTPGCRGHACDCGTYKPTDFTLAISSNEAQRYDVPPPPPLLAAWSGTEGRRVRLSAHETGRVVAVRTRDRALLVELDGSGKRYVYPMRTTELMEDGE